MTASMRLLVVREAVDLARFKEIYIEWNKVEWKEVTITCHEAPSAILLP
jgi:hypothetical protein